MHACSRFVITADLLRPYPCADGWESATWKQVRWLRHVLSRPLRGSGLPVSTLAWDDRACPRGNAWGSPEELYERLGDPLSPQGWARLCTRSEAPRELVEWLEPLVHDAFVIGYELPPVMIDALQRLGRPYVDVILHPLRFLPDLVFALRTNVPAYHAVFERFRLREEDVRQQADLICAKAAWMAPPLPMPPGTALLLGQVAGDRALVRPDGSFASLADHLDSLHRLCCDHPLVLYKAHPYAGPDDPSTTAVRRLPAVRETDANFYHLLAQPEIETVVALNSSGLHEARVFGREARPLIPFLYDFGSTEPPGAGLPGAPVPIDGAWTGLEFWECLLAGDGRRAGPPRSSATSWSNVLRRSMNADWGYGFIEEICA